MRPWLAMLALAVPLLLPGPGLGQVRPTPPAPAASKDEIRLDEPTTLKAAALEARASALLANLQLMQRQAQDMQQELQKILDERRALIQDAGKKANVDVKEPLEWALDYKGQLYRRVIRPPVAPATPTR
jgi:hypothetical protein